ncbi:MAG TPA: HTH domain-containing protein, partial [Clostridiales bacterium]|nr:HTH domain-containing protein [Clostridiales bacterium]
MSNISQVERQLHILSLLSENQRGFTIEEIMDSLRRIGVDVSRKTIQRDIDYITTNFFVYEDERNGKTVYVANKYSADNIGFTISELLSLHFAREILRPYSGLDVGKTAVNILDKLLSSVPRINRKYIDNFSEMVKVYTSGITPEKDFNREYLEIIKEAIAQNRKLRIEYYSF